MSTKVIVLGGAGDMGSRAVEELAMAEGIDRVTVADRNLKTAHRIAARLRDTKAIVDVKYIDANDHGGLVEAMRDYDVAASALGPFYLFESKLVRAAIEAGVNYISICDDWLAADEVISQFSERARNEGVTVITGLGASPGISNVGIRYYAQQMEKLRKVDIYVYQPLNAGGGEAVMEHMLFIMSGSIVVWREGRRTTIPALHEERLVDFPRFGYVKVWNMGHSEPVTVPKFISGVDELNFLMGFGPGSNWLVLPAKLGLFDGRWRRRVVAKLLSQLQHLGKAEEPEWGAVRIDAWGERSGEEVHEMACGIGQMRQSTGISLAVGTLMLARGEITTEEGGVYAPEACLDPVKFLTSLNERGITAHYDLEMTKPVV